MPLRLIQCTSIALGILVVSGLANAADRPELIADTGHSATIHSAAFSPNGKQVVTGSSDTTAIVWDVATSSMIRTLQGHTARVFSVQYSPDGKQIVTASADKTAIVWDAKTGERLRALQGHAAPIRSAAYSADGKWIVTASVDKTAVVWDAATGEKSRILKGHSEAVLSASYRSDGKRILTGSADKTAIVWDAATGEKLISLNGHAEALHSAAFSSDGKQIVTASADKSAIVWDASTGAKILTLPGHPQAVFAAAFSPDGKRIVTGCGDKTAIVWDDAGQKLRTLKGHNEEVVCVAFSGEGKRVLTGSGDSSAALWDAATGHRSRVFKGFTTQGWGKRITCVSYSPDGKRIVAGSFDKTAVVWDLTHPDKARKFFGQKEFVHSVMYSPDGKQIAAGSADRTAFVWDAASGQRIRILQGHADVVNSLAYSPDGKRIVTSSWDKTAIVWDAATGEKIRTLEGHAGAIYFVSYSPDGKRIVTGSGDRTAIVWDAATGAKIHTLQGHGGGVVPATFSPDGKFIVTGAGDWKAMVWNASTGERIRILQGHKSAVRSTTFSPDGKRIVTASIDSTAIVWDAATGEKLHLLAGHMGPINSAIYSPDGKWIITGSDDGSVRQWDAETGKELCQMIRFNDNTWAVIDPAGRFDGSNGGDVKGLHWVVGQEPIALKQLKDRYYDPGLLAKHFGFSKEPLREVAAFTSVKLYPEISVTQADPKRAQFDLNLTNRDGGIGRVVVKINGKESTSDARPRGADVNAARLATRLDLTGDPRLIPGKKNHVEVFALNGEGYLSSRGVVREFVASGNAAPERPSLHAIVVGVSQYRGEKLNLRFAAKDAEDFAAALRIAGGRMFGNDRVHLTVLSGAEGGQRPSRANLVQALETLRATAPGDIVVIYLAGHGVTQGGQDGDWHYLTADAQSAELGDPAVRQQVGMSSADLTDFLKAIPAQKQVLILDTCHAGRVVEKLTEKRDVPGSQIRALERVKDRTGMHVLAGCAADSVSYEASRYGQGILTYSLLLGMRGAKLREGEYVDVVDLFSFAADKVPELARDIGGVQRPTIASPRGASFDIGRLTAADRNKVPLQTVKPVLLRSSFQEEKRPLDGLNLTRRVNEHLRQASSAARGATLVFVDSDEFPGALQATGRYQREGDKVIANVTLYQGAKEIATFPVEGSATKPDDLAGSIAAEVEKKLVGRGGK